MNTENETSSSTHDNNVSMKLGDIVYVFSGGSWKTCKIIDISHHFKSVKVHWVGFDSMYDRWINGADECVSVSLHKLAKSSHSLSFEGTQQIPNIPRAENSLASAQQFNPRPDLYPTFQDSAYCPAMSPSSLSSGFSPTTHMGQGMLTDQGEIRPGPLITQQMDNRTISWNEYVPKVEKSSPPSRPASSRGFRPLPSLSRNSMAHSSRRRSASHDIHWPKIETQIHKLVSKRARRSKSQTGYFGVRYNTNKQRYRSTVSHDGKGFNVGTFNTKEEAAFRYDLKMIELKGPDVAIERLNFPALWKDRLFKLQQTVGRKTGKKH